MPPNLLSPWADFLKELDESLPEAISLHSIGGFVVTTCYGLPRPTGDIDYVSVTPLHHRETLQRLAGLGSDLAKRHKVYLQYVTVAILPDAYEERLVEMWPGRFARLRIFVPDPYDLILSKLQRNSPTDRADVAAIARSLALDPEVLRQRYREELRPGLLGSLESHDRTLDMWIEAYFADQTRIGTHEPRGHQDKQGGST